MLGSAISEGGASHRAAGVTVPGGAGHGTEESVRLCRGMAVPKLEHALPCPPSLTICLPLCDFSNRKVQKIRITANN